MRRGVVLAALLLPLSGCYEQPPATSGYAAQPGYPPPAGYGYAQPGYPPPPGYQQPEYQQPAYPPSGYQQPGYPPPGYPQPAYPAGAYDQYGNIYPGYSDNGGDPTLLVDGAVMPLILFGGGWGYWDSRHNWHRAPDAVSHHLEQQRAAGGGFHSDGGGFHSGGGGFAQPRPQGGPPPGAQPQGTSPQGAGPSRGQTFFHPTDQGRPAAAVAAAPAPAPVRPAAPPPAPARPAAAPPPAHEGRGHDCPPGQRC